MSRWTGGELAKLRTMPRLDAVDLDLLTALADDPKASLVALADRLGVARNTVYARMARLEEAGAFLSFERRINPETLGYPITAFISVTTRQKELSRIVGELERVPEVVQAHGMSGSADLVATVVAPDLHGLFDIDAAILAIEGVERTETSLSMGELIPYRVRPLVERHRRAASPERGPAPA
jgi:DNA-binding Lrp family transcriptional regulator